MSKARTLAGTVSDGAVLADGVVDASEIGSLTLPSGGDIVGTTAVQTLTNKTMDIANNTLTGVQPSLVSGTSIKTINGGSVLGSGDLAIAGVISDYQEFTSSGTWTKPAGATWVYVEAIGGGGGGRNNNGTSTVGAFGGGGGEYVSQIFRASDLGSSYIVTVGSGALGGANGGNNNGQDGGDSTFGDLFIAYGGTAGISSSTHRYYKRYPDTINNSQIYVTYPFPNISTPSGINRVPGSTIHAGGSGGPAGGSTAGNFDGATSEFAGNGGAGSGDAGVRAEDGFAPGGGGGASQNNGGAGNGANGIVRVYSW